MVITGIIISLIYAMMILGFSFGNSRIKDAWSNSFEPINLTILIPVRNEEQNLGRLFKSLNKQNYPGNKLAIVFVNDHSTDNSLSLIQNFISGSPFQAQLINLKEQEGKKAAILKGIESINSDWLISLDADCQVGDNFVNSICQGIAKYKEGLILGPVSLEKSNSGLFQQMVRTEFAALIASTSGSVGLGLPFMCNGANMTFKKELFLELLNSRKDQHIASGDDVFLLHAAVANKSKVSFLTNPESLVYTQSPETLKQFFNQRVRWAKKASQYKNPMALFTGLLVLGMNLIVLLELLSGNLSFALQIFLFKFLLDYLLLASAKAWLKINYTFPKAFLLSLFYPFYLIAVALLSLLRDPEWKGRKIKS